MIMENTMEHGTESRHFEIRSKIQSQIIADFYNKEKTNDVSGEQAASWINANAPVFAMVFNKTANDYPSFWNDAEIDFKGAVELVKQKMLEEMSHAVGK
jgi:hypothetical protein